jgi:hypothetical protein
MMVRMCFFFFDKALLQFILIPNRIYTKYQLSTWADPMQP